MRYPLFAILFLLMIPVLCSEVTLAERESSEKILRWAADAEGGAPYAFQDPKRPTRLIGFEADLVEALGRELDMKPKFVQNSWDGLILGLERKDYDIAINGIEITPDREARINFSDPYYLTYEQLTVRKGNRHKINSLASCKGMAIGTLKSSLAQRILEKEGGIQVQSYDDEINAYSDLQNKRLDAVLLDAPIALYYAAPNPRLKLVGDPIGKMAYGIAIRKPDTELLIQINTALRKIESSGELREILDRWNLWNPLIAEYLNDYDPSHTKPDEYKSFLASSGHPKAWFQRIIRYVNFLPLLAKGALVTLEVSILSMILAIILGLIIALIRLYTPTPFHQIATIYIESIRGTPLLIQLFFIFYGLPNIGIKLSPLVAAVLGLGLNYAAYEAENYRAGLISVPKGQMEAALALGMNQFQGLRYIVIPQALRIVLPPITNDFISLLKDSSLVSVITMVELTKVYGQLASTYYDYFGTGILVAIIYLLLGLPFVRLARITEKRLSIKFPHSKGATNG